jgi:hypothetical protein
MRQRAQQLGSLISGWSRGRKKQSSGFIGFHLKNPLEGYLRLTFMMLDADVVAGPAVHTSGFIPNYHLRSVLRP